MNKIKKILAPTDLSELSLAGVRYALNLARAVGAEVILYHAIEIEELMHRTIPDMLDDVVKNSEKAITRFLKAQCSDLLPGLEVHAKAELGTPDVNIVDEARNENVDLIVISTHGRTGFSHILVGSVTERVVRHAPCPVLSIRPDSHKVTAKAAA
jgi:nucleotide-binding universal stress UspA family protein